ncbi:MAG: elongation factor P [Nitrospinae bacterium]|nr:elongation factor P [Nitrospinota bacterium]MCH7645769.1 elongation factor P [Nitrospinota bacterium]
MIPTSQFRNGLKVELDGEPFVIVEFQHVKPGKGGAFVRTRLKSLKSGLVQDRTFRSGEKLQRPDLEERKMQFLYQDDGQWHFMDTATYEQIFLTAGQLGDEKNYLQENVVISALFHKGQPIGVQLPIFVELTITKTDPGFRGDTATGATKPATLETGFVVQVPLFLNEGERVRIDTRTGEYNERA